MLFSGGDLVRIYPKIQKCLNQNSILPLFSDWLKNKSGAFFQSATLFYKDQEAGGRGSWGGRISSTGIATFFLRRSRIGTTTAMAMKMIDRHKKT
jgi:hypothetical protein